MYTKEVSMDQVMTRAGSAGKRKDGAERGGDRRDFMPVSLLWPALAFVFYLMCAGSWAMTPFAAWLAPVFALRFIRGQKIWLGSIVSFLMILIAAFVSSQGVLRGSGAEAAGMAPVYILLLSVLLASRYGLPLVVDRILSVKVSGFLATLVFPLASVVVEFLYIQVSPFISIGSMSYTQFGDLPLTQIVSITGIWGLVFMLSWFGSVANWAWEMAFAPRAVRRGIGLFASVFSLILILGGLRTSAAAPRSATVQVAGIVASPQILALQPQLDEKDEWTDPRWRANSRKVQEYYLDRTRQQARAGAKIVAWQEYAAYVFPEDEESFIARGRDLAREEGIYLMMGLYTGPSEAAGGMAQNKLVWASPDGGTKEYRKSHPTGMESILLGDGKPVVLDTPYGRIASAICFDMDQPALARLAGRAGADIFIVPAYDWSGFTPMHTNISSFRGIENGASLVRIGGKTLTCAFDYQGRILSSAEFGRSSGAAMVAHVPTRGVRTIYSIVGDLFVWICAGGLLGIIGLAVARARRKSKSIVATD
jgi:apolipoprotein N-acyltransferase